MKLDSKYHLPNPLVILILTLIGAFYYHQYTHGIKDWLNNGLYLAGDPNFDFLYGDLGWWPKYFLFPFLIALPISYRLRFHQITISDTHNPNEFYKEVLHKLFNGSKKLEKIREECQHCIFRTERITFSGLLLGTDRIKVYLVNGKIEVIGRRKHLLELENWLFIKFITHVASKGKIKLPHWLEEKMNS